MKCDMRIEFVPGKFLHISDTLSRAHSPLISKTADLDEEAVLMNHILFSNLFATPDKLKEMKEETDKDEFLKLLKKHIIN